MKIISIVLPLVLLASCAGTEVKKADATAPAPKAPAETTASTTPQRTASSTTLTCKAGIDSRVIERIDSSNGCELRYTKFGSTSVVASSKNGYSHCDSVRNLMRANLEKSGFSCE